MKGSVTIRMMLLFLVVIPGCRSSPMEEYNDQVKKEKASKRKVNDIFFGISMGMPSKDFYLHCWNMNKKGIFTDGSNNTAVNYKLVKNELKHPAEMNFYPEFHEGKIRSMWVRIQYAGWVPWNKELNSEHLLPDVLALYKKWYPDGNPFIMIPDKKRGTIYVKVDGNRRIIIGRFDDVQVKVDYTDMDIEQGLNN